MAVPDISVSALKIGVEDRQVSPAAVFVVNPLNVLELLAFLITALIITRLVSRARREANVSQRQKERLDRLYQFAQQLLAMRPETAVGEETSSAVNGELEVPLP